MVWDNGKKKKNRNSGWKLISEFSVRFLKQFEIVSTVILKQFSFLMKKQFEKDNWKMQQHHQLEECTFKGHQSVYDPFALFSEHWYSQNADAKTYMKHFKFKTVLHTSCNLRIKIITIKWTVKISYWPFRSNSAKAFFQSYHTETSKVW